MELHCFFCNAPILRRRRAKRPACRTCSSKGTPSRWRLDHPEDILPTNPALTGTGLDLERTQRQLTAARKKLIAQHTVIDQEIEKLTKAIQALSYVTGTPDEEPPDDKTLHSAT